MILNKMNPVHEQYARASPSNSLEQLFALLESFDDSDQSALASHFLIEIQDADTPPIDALEHFKSRCHILSKAIPESLVVQKLLIGCLWQLLTSSESASGRTRRRKPASDTGQRSLFPEDDEDVTPPIESHSRTLYDSLCKAIRKHLLSIPDAHEQSVALLALSEIRGVGYWTVRRLVQQRPLADLFSLPSTADFNSALRSVGSKGSLDANIPLKEWRERAFVKGERMLAEFADQSIRIVHRFSPDFPSQLNDLEDPPEWLFVQGNVEAIHQRSIAVVGTRNPTRFGFHLAEIIGQTLPQLKSALVSGLADGIDQTMHVGSIKHNVPTIAVLGTGILNNYPSGSEEIRSDICRHGGAIVTEYLPRDTYSSQNFVRRNRIQAGLATVIIPVEWQAKSGTAHTVRFAHETHRQIVCVKPPEWQVAERPELLLATEMGASVFTLPDELEQFIAAVSG